MEATCFYNPKKEYWVMPADPSNEITYQCFCLYGGLANPRCRKVIHKGGRISYHDVFIPKEKSNDG